MLRADITNLLGLSWSQLLKKGAGRQADRWMERESFHFNIIDLNVLIKTS